MFRVSGEAPEPVLSGKLSGPGGCRGSSNAAPLRDAGGHLGGQWTSGRPVDIREAEEFLRLFHAENRVQHLKHRREAVARHRMDGRTPLGTLWTVVCRRWADELT
ncbi:hypothetical protein [Saccharopolyspora hattusasensis]|uniref:hypothetical protein n=1 Tax=Saccharopolyspora hattusasensis TaxID=1128679 RepID=UPI003D970E8E